MRTNLRFAAAAITAVGLSLAACVPDPGPGGPTVIGDACDAVAGVTVVVDFVGLDGTIRVGCAEGVQASGFSALTNAGFTQADGGVTGVVCTIDSQPADPGPTCFDNGFWSYWDAAPGGSWGFSATGAADGPISEGSIEGWSWASAPSYDSSAPRVTPAQLGLT